MKKVISLLVAVSIFLTACGGGSGDSSQGVTDTTVKVGNSIATSGALAPVGVPFKAGIEAYFKMINDGGGVNGRTIEYIHQDDEFDPVKGKAAMEKLVHDEQVFALVGHFGTPIVGATLDDLVNVGIPTVYFATGTGILYNENATGNERAMFPVQPVYPMEGRIMAAWADGKFEATKIGVIYTGDDAGKDLLEGIEKEAAESGIEVVSEQVVVGDADVSAAVTKINSENPDVIVVAAIQNTFPQIIKELAKQGNTADVITTYVNADPTMTAAVNADVNGSFDVYANTWIDLENSTGYSDYVEWIAQVSNEDFSSNAYAMTGWIAAHFFVEGLKAVGDDELTWENYIDAMESNPIQNPFGGEIDYANGARLGTGEMGLVKMNIEEGIGWENVEPVKSLEDIKGE